ncbi:MAG: hypothetical protein JXR13_13810 [Thalassovita sp.]
MSRFDHANTPRAKARVVNPTAERFGVCTALMVPVFVWVGAAVSGNLIAAPAKFQAPSLSLPVALDVGRMQFQWIGLFELACVLGIVAVLLWYRAKPPLPLIAALCLFAIQRLWFLPLLDTRTLRIIAGQPVEESALHLLYVAAEVLKVAYLIWGGCWLIRAATQQA